MLLPSMFSTNDMHVPCLHTYPLANASTLSPTVGVTSDCCFVLGCSTHQKHSITEPMAAHQLINPSEATKHSTTVGACGYLQPLYSGRLATVVQPYY